MPIEVREHGGSAGPAVVVLHGGPGAPGSAAGLARSLGPGFRVMEPLQRRSGDVPLTVARHVADLAEVAPASALVVGWSWGAMLGLSYASRHPERVKTLALVGCGTYGEAARAAYRAAMDVRLGAEGRRRMDALAAAGDLAAMGHLATEAQSVDLLPEDDDALAVDARGHDETWRDVLRLQREGIEPAAFRAIRAPVLMLHGDDDPHPGARTREDLAAHIPGIAYVGFPRCGHAPWRERHARDAFLGALRAFLSAHAG